MSMKHMSNGSSNPEIVGSIPTEVKIFFFTSCGSLIPLLGLTPSGLFMDSISALIYTSELILCSTIKWKQLSWVVSASDS